ncbi:hypothetical protein Gohar_017094, partial [Gossypium harknessii]|nr:hypothetical protein [Gossypium harknessii]
MEEALADLRLTDEGDSREMEAWEIEKEVVAGELFSKLCLVGCFLTATTINFQSMRTVMANLWHPLGGISIMEVEEKRFVFQFYCEIDFDRVVKGTPWTFNNHLLVFHHLKQGEGPLEVDLLFTSLWIQIHNFPPGMFMATIAKQFGDFIGTFVDYDVKTIAAGLRNYMWIRVKIDIRQSLKRKKKLIVVKKEFFATFKYERLTTFYFLCGKLGHSENCCPKRMIEGRKELPLEWDISLKASPRQAATGSSIWLRDLIEFWGKNQGISRNE